MQTSKRLSGWTIGYLLLMAVGLAAAAYHLSSERYGNAVIAAGASLLGIVFILTDPLVPVAPRAARERHRPGVAAPLLAHDATGPRPRWLSGAIIAGFTATIVMTILLLLAYLAVGYIGSEDGGTLSRWFWGLTHNDLTNGVYDIPIAAFSINLLAGLGWAFVYAAFVEPRLAGPGWRKGLLFAVVPWLLSLVVFLPLVGGGILGLDLDAGPLPALGNLLLHLAWGLTLGAVYAIPEVSALDTEDETRATQLENDGIAAGLAIGLIAGLVLGAIASGFAAPSGEDAVDITLIGGAIGTVIGGVLGPFLGLDWGERHAAH